MSNILAFDWDDQAVRFVLATLSGKQVCIEAALAIPLGEDVDPSDAASVGELLKRELVERKIKPDAVIGCIDRQHVILHDVLLPAVPANELAKMIHFQATVDFVLADEQSTYDYLLDSDLQAGVERALVAIVPNDRIEQVKSAAEALGVGLSAIRLQPMARTAARRHWGAEGDQNSETIEILLAPGKGLIEAIASRQGQVLFSQLTPLPPEPGERSGGVRSALRRLRAQLSAQTPPLSAEGVAALCPAEAAWIGELDLSEDQSVELCDPFETLSDVPDDAWGHLATLAGALAEEVENPNASIDFLNPRRPAEPHPLRRYRTAIAAGVALLVLAIGGLKVGREFQAKDSEYDYWRNQHRTIVRELKRLRPYVRQHDSVARWLDTRVNWLEAYEELLTLLPDASQLYLTQVTFSSTGSVRAPGAIHLEGYAASRETVTSIALRLAEYGRYRLRPIALHAASGNPNYPQRFEAEITLLGGSRAEHDGNSKAPDTEKASSEIARR